MQTMLYLL